MSKRLKSGIAFAKRKLKLGAGRGNGSEYVPFLNVRDVPSLGVGVRRYWDKTGRVHHMLSLLEASAFIYFASLRSVVDIREQYPLPLEETIRICGDLKIKHPGLYRGKPNIHIQTTDLVLTVEDPKFWRTRTIAVYIKYTKELRNKREQEKLALHRTYWEEQNADFMVLTENTIPRGLVRNLELLEMAERRWPLENEPLSMDYRELIEEKLMTKINSGMMCLGLTCRQFDDAMNFAPGTSLETVRYNLALGKWDLVDWTTILNRNSFIKLRRVEVGENLERRVLSINTR